MRTLILSITAFDLCAGVYPHLINQDDEDPYEVLIHQKKPTYKDPHPYFNKAINIAEHRNEVRKMALQTNADFFFWVDSDILVPLHALRVLKSSDQSIMGGWCPIQGSPLWAGGLWDEQGFNPLTQVESGVSEVSMAGLACLLLKREVMEKIEFNPGIDLKLKRYENGEEFIAGTSAQFGVEALKMGYSIFMDGNVVCQHLQRSNQP